MIQMSVSILLSPALARTGAGAPFRKAIHASHAAWAAPREEAAYAGLLPDAEVLVTTGREALDLAPARRLRWLHIQAAGYDNVPLDEVRSRGITVTNTVAANSEAMAEHAILCILALAKQFPFLLSAQARRAWEPPAGHPLPASDRPISRQTRELDGATLGIVGLGAAGEATAQRAKAFRMRVIGFRRDPSGYTGHADEAYAVRDFTAHVGRCDYVLLAVAHGPETHHIVRAETIAAFKPDACLLNIGRGKLVDHDAVTRALRSGRLGGAALDVFETEPLPADSPLWSLPNVIITPHCAGYSPHFSERSAAQFAANFSRFLAGEPLSNRIA